MQIRERVSTGKAGRPPGAGRAMREQADVDKALEECAYVLQQAAHRALLIQAGREVEVKTTALPDSEVETLIKSMRALADTQAAVDDAKERMKQRIDGMTDERLYTELLGKTIELGKKLGRGALTEGVVGV